MTYKILWGINALIVLIFVVFFFIGLADGSVSSFNIVLWLVVLAALGGILWGSYAARAAGRTSLATRLLMVLAIPRGPHWAALLGGPHPPAKMELSLSSMTSLRTTGKRQSFTMRLIAVLFSIFIVAASTQAEEQAPEDAVRLFYAWALAHPSGALPSPKERAQFANILSPDIIQLLKSASDTEAKCIKAAPKGEKPLIIEGDLFVGNYEGATEVAYRDLRRKGNSVVVEADLLYVDTRFPKAHKHRAVAWRDRLELRLVGDRWYVQDVQFPKNRSLVAALKAYIEDGSRSCSKP